MLTGTDSQPSSCLQVVAQHKLGKQGTPTLLKLNRTGSVSDSQ